MLLRLMPLCLVAGFTLPQAFSQSKAFGEISGVITDPSGAAVPDATIVATNRDTAIQRETTSGPSGEYRFLLMPPGLYDLRAEGVGFTAQSKRGIEVTVGQTATIDFQMSLGPMTQTVEVEAETPLIESERSQQSNTLNQNAVRNLPINRRDYLTFALLAPGISDSKAMADANSYRVKQTPDSGLSFYGSNGRGNSVTIDGGEANDPGGGVRPTVSQEVVQEFQVNRTNYSAEHGGARGGVINIVTKSGTNRVQGSLFAFFRHQSLDATDPFALNLENGQLRRVKPNSDRQQFGGTLGGPLVKDRTFYFLGYERLRRREAATVPVLTDPSIFEPTREQEAILGNLPPAAAAQLRAALTASESTRELFRLNSGIFPFQSDDHKAFFRLDHRLSEKDQANFRYNFTDLFETNQNLRAQVGFSRGFVSDIREHTGLLGWTRLLSPTAVNEARVQFNYYQYDIFSNDAFGPEININGFGFFNRDIFLPSPSRSRRTEILDNLSLAAGSHSLKVGGQVLVRNIHNSSATFFSGRFTFGSLPGVFVSPVLANAPLTALQAFNLGLPQTYQQGFGNPTVTATHPLYAGFVQDTWKLRPALTLSFGVRYEVDTRRTPLRTDKNNLAPRFGFAWTPGKDRKTVVRAGYGLYYGPTDFQIDYVVNALNEINGFRQIAQVLSVLNAAAPTAPSGPINIFQTLRRQGVIGVPTPSRSIQAEDLAQFGIRVSQTGPRPPLTVLFRESPDFVNAYSQQASFGIEREVAHDLTVGATYIWSRGLKIPRSRDLNLLPAPVDPRLGIRVWSTPYFRDPLLLQENVYESAARSWYNGALFEVTKRFTRNMTLHFNYTFSKAQDEVVDFNSDFQPADQTDMYAEKALSAFDQRHKVVFYGVFSTPSYKRSDGAARRLAADWQFAPIFRTNSSRPFNLLTGFELNQDRHNTTDRPVGAGRNTGAGPKFVTFDLRLSRRIRITETASLELMFESFNLFNQLNYATVNNVVSNMPAPFDVRGRHDRTPSEPLGYTSAFEPRRIQLGLRFRL